MMDHVYQQSKEDRKDEPSDSECDRNDEGTYYYDDATNYETYRDDDDEESATQTANTSD